MLAVKTDGTLWTWGRNVIWAVLATTTLSTVLALFKWALNKLGSGSVGGIHTAAITTDGTFGSWGAGYQGRLGDDDTVY
jgi:alpha-tubulin suppressor-like RCC1 family protein